MFLTMLLGSLRMEQYDGAMGDMTDRAQCASYLKNAYLTIMQTLGMFHKITDKKFMTKINKEKHKVGVREM